jgi:ribosomal protein L11 methyltransferase
VRTWPALLLTGPALGRPDDPTSDLLSAALTDYTVAAIDEPSPDARRAFFHDGTERDRARANLPSSFPDLQMAAVDVEDEDWAARSQANLTAVTVGRLIVAPPWHAAAARATAGSTTVVIQPSMGFGTGHHATTRLCLAALQRINLTGHSVIDVGTGSGVLAIAASLLGASPVIALDDDPDAIQSAAENLELNAGATVDVRIGDLRSSAPGVADLVLANLTGALLVQAAALLEALVAPQGRLLLSGLMQHETSDVVAAFQNLSVLDRAQEDEWMCLELARAGAFQ